MSNDAQNPAEQDNQTAAPNTAAPTPAPKAGKAPKAATKAARVRSLVGPFTILHSNVVIGDGEEKKVELDAWVQLQIDAGKLEIVVD